MADKSGLGVRPGMLWWPVVLGLCTTGQEAGNSDGESGSSPGGGHSQRMRRGACCCWMEMLEEADDRSQSHGSYCPR